MRILVDLPDDMLRQLDALAKRRGWSRAAAVREAVNDLLARDIAEDRAALMALYGAWKDHDIDGLAHQQAMRAEWDRPWDRPEADEAA
jgi:metal-responsive CopG/Arc/MetJ family transcriptional regulator